MFGRNANNLARRAGAALLFSVPLATVGQAPVQDNAALGERVSRLEKVVNSETLVELLTTVQALQREMQSLRGEVEVQGHELSQIKQRQRELYLDLDRRLQRLETGQGGVAVAPPQPPASPPEPVVATAPPVPPPAAIPQPPTPAPDPNVRTLIGTAPAPPEAATMGAAAPAAAASAFDPAEEQRAYQAAFDLLKAGRYEQASQAFSEFLVEYPNGEYSDNAQYWLAEAYYVNRKFEPALQHFETLVATHPNSQKLTHALLKIGYIHDEQGRREDAQRVLNELITRFPQSTAAGLARKRLQRIQSG